MTTLTSKNKGIRRWISWAIANPGYPVTTACFVLILLYIPYALNLMSEFVIIGWAFIPLLLLLASFTWSFREKDEG